MASRWRGLDLGRWQVTVTATLRRLACPTHGVCTEAVPFARHRSGFTRDFEDLVALLATKTDKTTITRLARIDWDSVGRICARVVADGLDPGRLGGDYRARPTSSATSFAAADRARIRLRTDSLRVVCECVVSVLVARSTD